MAVKPKGCRFESSWGPKSSLFADILHLILELVRSIAAESPAWTRFELWRFARRPRSGRCSSRFKLLRLLDLYAGFSGNSGNLTTKLFPDAS